MYEGALVRLRPYGKDDTETVWKYINDPEIKQYLAPGIPYPITLNDEEKWILSQSAMQDTYSFAIEDKDTCKYLGGCGINHVDWKNSHATVGIFIGDKEFHGKGYGTDAMRTLVKFIFNEMNIRKVKLEVYAFNERALRSYEKCGFKKEGSLREEIFRFGKFHDIIIMSVFRGEFIET